MTDLELKRFNEIFKTFTTNLKERNLDFYSKVDEVNAFVGKKYRVAVGLDFEAIKTVTEDRIQRAIEEAQKDHLASILAMCGLL